MLLTNSCKCASDGVSIFGQSLMVISTMGILFYENARAQKGVAVSIKMTSPMICFSVVQCVEKALFYALTWSLTHAIHT